jgi:hypothetical protein
MLSAAFVLGAEAPACMPCRSVSADRLEVLRPAFAAGLEHRHRLRAQVHDAAETLALADRPGHRHAGHAELALDLVEDVERLAHLAVHLVDEGDDGRVALAADLDQPPRLRFHAVGRVDHHQAESTAVSTR